MKQFEFIGKKRTFKRVKMSQLMDLQEEIQNAVETAQSGREQLLAMGSVVEKFLTPFDAEEMLDAEFDEFYLVQGLHLLATAYKHNKPKKEIDQLKADIIDSAIQMQVSTMKSGRAAASFR